MAPIFAAIEVQTGAGVASTYSDQEDLLIAILKATALGDSYSSLSQGSVERYHATGGADPNTARADRKELQHHQSVEQDTLSHLRPSHTRSIPLEQYAVRSDGQT